MDRITDGRTLAQALVDTVRESLLVLDGDLRVVAASRSFYTTFQTTAAETEGRLVYDLGSGEWNNPALRELLERIIPEHGVMDHFEVEQDFPTIGPRTMLLNARKVFYQGDLNTTLSTLCEALSGSVVRERRPITLSVVAGPGNVKSEQAVSIGLIVTELVINALKYAFSVDIAAGEIVVGYKVSGAEWTLSVSDNGVGMQEKRDKNSTGLGTTLVKALAQQLEAQVEIKTGKNGASITNASV